MSHRAGFWKGCCTPTLICKILLIVGGINWGLVGVGMLVNSDAGAWNLIHMVVGSVPTIEGVVYVLVGVAAVMKIFGCKCEKCLSVCSSCGADDKMAGTM